MLRHLFFILRLVIGIGLLVIAVRRVDFSPAASLSFSSLSAPWALAALAFGGLSVVGWAMRWHVFLRIHGIHLKPGETMRLTLFADFFNLYFLGPLGADGLRLLLLSRKFPDRKKAIVTSIFLDHVSGLMGGAILYFLITRPQSAWLTANHSLLSQALLTSTDIILTLLCASTFMGLWMIHQPKLQVLFKERLGLGFMIHPLMPFAYLRDHTLDLFKGQLISILSLLFGYAAYWSAGEAAGYDIPVQQLMAVMPVVEVVTALPISISGIGVRENLFVELLGKQLALGSAGALAVSLLGFAAVGVWGLIGGVWLALYRRQTGLQLAEESASSSS